jgi:hypothetical protein
MLINRKNYQHKPMLFHRIDQDQTIDRLYRMCVPRTARRQETGACGAFQRLGVEAAKEWI